MKRTLNTGSRICLSVFMLTAGSLHAAVSGLFTYEVVNGEVHITDYPDDETGHVEIPAEIDGKPVTAIIDAFMFSKLGSVTIPTSVTLIGDLAFAACFNLESVVIPDSVTTLGEGAFYQCYRMKSVTFGSNVTSIGELAFFTCASLTSIVLPPGITTIAPRAFESCNHLQSVTFNEGLTTIGASAFLKCFRLKSITIPASVTLMENNCFVDCPLSSAVFLGDAPTVTGNLFRDQDPDFRVFFINGKKGFTEPLWNPKWEAFPSQSLNPEIDVEQPPNTKLTDGKSKLNFGAASVAKKGRSQTLRISNTGDAPLTGLTLMMKGRNSNDFVMEPLAKTELSPGTKTSFKVAFVPKGAGPRTATLHLKSDDADEGTFTIELSGEGRK